MSTREALAESEIVQSHDDLVAWIAAGEKPADQWRLGTEHEKFVFDLETKMPVPYEGPRGIRQLMSNMMDCCGWRPVIEQGNIIALKRAPGEAGDNISLEPGGQFELSGAPLKSVHDTFEETRAHIVEVKRVAGELGIGFAGMGFTPTWSLADIPSMPKERYKVMRGYMPLMGARGLDMMYRTATIQVNLDFASERDLVDKMRISLALQPIATALFAASPFVEGKPNGFQSTRSEVWRDTDPDRTGMLPYVFEDGMSYEAYVNYALDVPMYFVYRDGVYHDVSGASFRDFLQGRLRGFEGKHPTLDDWSDHLTTIFPEVRLKRFLEMRGADSGHPAMIYALTAFWTGLLYDGDARRSALDMIQDWSAAERQALRDDVPKAGLAARFRDTTVRSMAREILELASAGLERRGLRDAVGEDERAYLKPLQDIVESGKTQAQQMIDLYNSEWEQDARHAYDWGSF